MKNSFLLILLFCVSSSYAQQHISTESILEGTFHMIDSAEEQRYRNITERYELLLKTEATMTKRLDSLQQLIKKENDELLKARLDILLMLIKNEKANDVYEKMREFGDKAVLAINKDIAPPAWFYKLDKEYARQALERKEIEATARSMSENYNTKNTIELAKRDAGIKATPYDSLRLEMQLHVGENNPDSFLSQLCRLYKKPVSTEKTVTMDCEIERIIICGEKAEVFEKKTWAWGGVFCFYNGATAITLEEYTTNSNASSVKALKYSEQNKLREK